MEIAQTRHTTVRDLVRYGTSLLKAGGVVCDNSMGTPFADAKYLVFWSLRLPYFEDSLLGAEVTPQEVQRALRVFQDRIERRVTAQYLTNEAYYNGYYFYVDSRVLTPRSIMFPYFKELLHTFVPHGGRVVDVCAGSGCIGLTLALLRPDICVDLLELSDGALEVAKINIARFKLAARGRAVRSDLLASANGSYDLVISNPPYVGSSVCDQQPLEYQNEPRMALDGGHDGLALVERLLRQAPHVLNPAGGVAMEVGYDAGRLLATRHPGVPFRWWGEPPPEEPSGVFSLGFEALGAWQQADRGREVCES